MAHWLMKTEPEDYTFERLTKDKKTAWTGVRNNQAALNLKAMKKGDTAFFYRSMENPAIVGVMKIIKEHYPAENDPDGRWVQVDVAPVKAVKNEVGLKEIKADKRFSDLVLVRNSRLSVQPVSDEHWSQLCALAGVKA